MTSAFVRHSLPRMVTLRIARTRAYKPDFHATPPRQKVQGRPAAIKPVAPSGQKRPGSLGVPVNTRLCPDGPKSSPLRTKLRKKGCRYRAALPRAAIAQIGNAAGKFLLEIGRICRAERREIFRLPAYAGARNFAARLSSCAERAAQVRHANGARRPYEMLRYRQRPGIRAHFWAYVGGIKGAKVVLPHRY